MAKIPNALDQAEAPRGRRLICRASEPDIDDPDPLPRYVGHAPSAERLFAALETDFEDDGYPLAAFDIDEAQRHQEVSLYTDDDPDERRGSASTALLESWHRRRNRRARLLPDIDWVAQSLEGLQPVRAGRFLVHGSHDRDRRRIGDLAIEIEAGLAFGTGHHGTTSGCLEMIEKVVRREQPRNALDLGTGSAVLAIALAKTGAYSGAGDRHRPGRDQGRRRQCPAERGLVIRRHEHRRRLSPSGLRRARRLST